MISIVMAYYNNPTMLKRQLQEWASYRPDQKEKLEVVIVDDGSKEDAFTAIQEWRLARSQGIGFQLKLFQVLVDIPWNQDGARNLAMRNVSYEWALMTDMDHLLPAEEVDGLLASDRKRGCYYMPLQKIVDGTTLDKRHPNTFLMNVLDFWRMGGYDEDFAGYYGSDGNFRRCAVGAGLVEQPTSDFATVVYRRDDIHDASTRTLGRKGSQYHVSNNLELMAKRKQPPYKATNPIRFPYERLL